MAGLSDGQTMLCVAGDFNAHIGVVEPGDEESIGTLGWGTRNMERRELADMLRRNRRVGVCSSDATSMKHIACGPASESMKFCS